MATSLAHLFHPQSAAVIGASRDERSMSGSLVRNLLESFQGPIYLINPNTDRIGSRPAYRSILDTPGPVDLALVAVPARHVLAAVRECVSKPVKAMVVISAGFAETGDRAAALEREIVSLVRTADIPLVGPNCLGLLSNGPSPLNGTFGPPLAAPGDIAVATQSGALGFVLPEQLQSLDRGLCALVSLGNKLVLGENDFLEYWLGEPSVRTVLLYLESFQDPRRLLALGRELAKTKTVALLKAGRCEAGQRAAGSHTAALASPDRLADGLCRQAGIARVETLEELLHLASLAGRQPAPRGRRVGVLTNAGGLGVLCVDSLVRQGFQAPEFSTALQAQLRSAVPPHAAVGNPIDLVASVDPRLFGHCLDKLLAGEEVDSVVVLYVPRLKGTSPDIAREIERAHRASSQTKTVLAVFSEQDEALGRLQREVKSIPCFRFPESAARALALAAHSLAAPGAGRLPPVSLEDSAPGDARSIVHSFLARNREGGWLDPAESFSLLTGFGLPCPTWRVVHSQGQLVQAAEKVGFPVAIKASAPGLVHKSASGGVVLDVRTRQEASDAWTTLSARFPSLSSVLVQQYAPGKSEAIVGVQRTSGFGHVIGLGAGGVSAEQLQRIDFRLLPLESRDAWSLVCDSPFADRGSAGEKPGAAMVALHRALLRVAALVAAAPEIDELDLNPLALSPSRPSLLVLDARIHLRPFSHDSDHH